MSRRGAGTAEQVVGLFETVGTPNARFPRVTPFDDPVLDLVVGASRFKGGDARWRNPVQGEPLAHVTNHSGSWLPLR